MGIFYSRHVFLEMYVETSTVDVRAGGWGVERGLGGDGKTVLPNVSHVV